METENITYCLGTTHVKCDTCQHEKNWKALNTFPDELRLAIQSQALRINTDLCRLNKMKAYTPEVAAS